MNEKQQQLLFDKGITNVPSDALCSDNALAESVGMIYDDGEHRVIQKPEEYLETSLIIRYIHKFAGEVRYICFDGEKFVWKVKSGTTLTGSGSFNDVTDANAKVTSVGKTLIFSSSGDIIYYLWKPNKYNWIGPIPMPVPRFRLKNFEVNTDPATVTNLGTNTIEIPGYNYDYKYTEPKYAVKNTLSHEGIFNTKYGKNYGAREPGKEANAWPEKYQKEYNDLVLGLYAKNKKAVAENKCFCNPFFVRVGLELYDGTFTHITQPILMLTSVKQNSWARMSSGFNFTLYTVARELLFKQETDYTDWSDIVKDVVIFVSDDIDVYDTTMDVKVFTKNGTFTIDGVYKDDTTPDSTYKKKNQSNFVTNPESSYDNGLPYHINPLITRSEKDIYNSIESTSTFYKLCCIGKNSVTSFSSTRDKIESHVLENITTQDQLEYDDYFSGCKFKASSIYSYNSRLNLANVQRGFFDGYDFFMAYNESTTQSCTVYIHTDTAGDVSVVKNNVIGNPALYFYYPDPRAFALTVGGYTYKLKEHQGLHGAFLVGKLPGFETSPHDNTYSESINNVSQNTYESLYNYILTSEVNNPFLFKAEGYNQVGLGKVMAISSATMALSQDQFGQTDLIVFSDNGVWGMKMDGTGLFKSVHPFTRDVCNNPKSITQADGAVFFTTKKGLMMANDKGVVYLSGQMSGKTIEFTIGDTQGEEERIIENVGNFSDFLEDCFIAYDYRDSLLWLFHANDTACYVYSIKSGTFAHYSLDNPMVNVANNYPDYLLQDGSKVYSLTDREDINADSGTYKGVMVTRSMKLENALALKSIMQVKHIHDLSDGASVTLRIFASNNLKNWVELKSLRGIPWKYYRFKYDFSNMKATDRFAGTMLVTQERRTDKLR